MTTTPTGSVVDQTVLQEFLGRAVGDLGATLGAALVVIGDRLGLYGGWRRRRAGDGNQPDHGALPAGRRVFLAAMTPARSR